MAPSSSGRDVLSFLAACKATPLALFSWFSISILSLPPSFRCTNFSSLFEDVRLSARLHWWRRRKLRLFVFAAVGSVVVETMPSFENIDRDTGEVAKSPSKTQEGSLQARLQLG